MPLEVGLVPKSSVTELTHLMYAAYREDPTSKLFYTVPASSIVLQGSIDATLANWGKDPTERKMQVTDTETGEMVSSSDWYFIRERQGEEWKTPPVVADRVGWHGDAYKTIIRESYLKRVELMGAKPYICKF